MGHMLSHWVGRQGDPSAPLVLSLMEMFVVANQTPAGTMGYDLQGGTHLVGDEGALEGVDVQSEGGGSSAAGTDRKRGVIHFVLTEPSLWPVGSTPPCGI